MVVDLNCMGILAHPLRPPTYPVAQRIQQSLQARGITTWLHTQWQDDDVRQDVGLADLVVAIGGDGAMLRAARVCAPMNVPVLGLNMGQLGFLTEVAEPDNWELVLSKLLDGDYWIENRTMIRAVILRQEKVIATGEALNEFVLSGSVIGRMVQLETYIDDDWTTNYYADALVIATATGSTAYALALGGPILPPELSNILIIPSAPHLSMDRPIVLSEGARVEVVPHSGQGVGMVLLADGVQVGQLVNGDRVLIQVSEHISRFVRLRERNYFYRSLLDKFEPRRSDMDN